MTDRQAPDVKVYIDHKAWQWRLSGNQFNIQVCPLCSNTNWKFFVNKDNGLWDCKVCGKEGNFYELAKELGDKPDLLRGVVSSSSEIGGTGKKPEALPDIEKMHAALLEHEDAMEYLTFERGFSLETITKMKLGVDTVRDGKTWIVYPYMDHGKLLYVKWRTLPPQPKDFRGTSGREVPLYNSEVIVQGLDELFLVEGEADCVAMINQGFVNTVGIPGARTKKADWIDKLDNAAPKKMYLLYDTDKVGQDAAREMAKRIDMGKVYNILLPEFEIEDAEGNKKAGKDINEWFRAGHTLEEFAVLKRLAKPFDVAGVTGLADALGQLDDEANGVEIQVNGVKTPWKTLNPLLGTVQWGDVVGVIAEGKVGKTTFVLNWLDYLVRLGYTCFLYCLEMLPRRLAAKWVSMVTQIAMVDDVLPQEAREQARKIADSREGELLFGYTNGKNPKDEVFDVIRQAVRRYGCKIVAFDNLQLLSRSVDSQQSEINVLSKTFKQVAMELGIILILIIQPNRVGENTIVSARNAAGSSAIEKDVDAMISLHRTRKGVMTQQDFQTMSHLDVKESLTPEMRTSVDMARYAPGGVTVLWMDGELSTVSEMDDERRSKLPKRIVTGNTVPTEDDQGFGEA